MSRVDTDAMRRYEQTRDELVARLLVLEELIGDERRATVAQTRNRVERGKFVLAVVGEFSSGKSFLLNALLGKYRYEPLAGGQKHITGLLATDINPSTATITELEYGESDVATAVYEDGRRERIPLDVLNRFVAVGSGDAGKIHDATKDERDAPSRVVVSTNSAFLQRGIVVADTPGLASINPAHRRATLQFLPTADAVLYLIDTQQPFTEGDAAFLGIVRAHIDSIFIVQTKIDLWQQPQNDGRPAWEHAYERIATLAAIHAPGTYVYALSAREFVEGTLEHDEARVEASRFTRFLSALDASLIRRTGRARLRRAHDQVRAAVEDASTQIGTDVAMLALDGGALAQRRAELLPALQALDERARAERTTLLAAGMSARTRLSERVTELGEELERALGHAFDTADIAKLRDRARLHIIVDRVVAHVVEEFADAVSMQAVAEIDTALTRMRTVLPIRFSLNDAAAHAFGAEPGSSLWSGDVRAALAATIVLDAIGGPAIAVAHDIAMRFSSRTAGTYMKRELSADLHREIFPRLRTSVDAFAQQIGARLQRLYDEFASAISRAVVDERDAQVGSVDRALAAHARDDADATRSRLEARRSGLHRELLAIGDIVDRFMERDEEIAPADPGASAVRRSHADASFDPSAYDRGLRPSRWRVAVLGALRRGKTSLINAIAGRTVLTDDVAASVRFPVHVRYGERDAAFCLDEAGQWCEIPFDHATAQAAESPVLLLVPWSLPRELVLVHAPAFDSGDANAEDINVVAASHASEVLCLFSRQLSDRELALYERVAEFNKPMIFAHTIADNEEPSERRVVVELAKQYLRERNIPAERVFTVSSYDYERAKREQRAPAGWNETEALRVTIEGHAEAHMARLERLARAAHDPTTHLQQPAHGVSSEQRSPGLFARFFGKGR